MTAIITDKIKRLFLTQLYDEAEGLKKGDSDNYYYIGIGRSQLWSPQNSTDNPPTPTHSERNERLFRYNAQSIKAVEAFSFVVPIRNWTQNTQYSQYNDNITGQPATSYYMKTEDNNVYVCIRNGKNALGAVQVSTVKPNHTDTTLPIETDGYVWKFLYTISVTDNNNFLTSNYMPVKFVDSARPTDPDAPQYAVQNAAIPGQIIGYRVISGGSNYDSASTTISIEGDGSGATAYPVISAGAITAVEVGESAGTLDLLNFFGSGYNQAVVNVTSSTGVNASVVPVFAHWNGLGADPREDLRSTSMMFHIKPEGAVNDDWITGGQDYRQIALWKNPYDSADGNKFTATSGRLMKKMLVTERFISGTDFTDNVIITGISVGDSNAQAWVDWVQDSTIWYHQDEYTGFTPFQPGATIQFGGDEEDTKVIASLEAPDVDRFSGDIYFINNNVEAQPRTIGSTDDIKLVIQL